MALVTATEVKDILDNTTLSDAIVNTFITSADALINEVLSTSGLSAVILKEIERWLTAHMISISRERQAKREEAGGAKIEYTGEYGLNLSSTSYGQMALSLDTTNTLVSLGGRKMTIFAIPSFT